MVEKTLTEKGEDTMKRSFYRKVTPKVKAGTVQKKHRHQYSTRLGYVIDRQSTGKGYKHVVTKRDIKDFVAIIPNWAELSDGIELILLSSGTDDYAGLYEHFNRESTAIIELPAWENDLWQVFEDWYFEDHRHIFDKLGVAYDKVEEGWECRFTLSQAKAFTLLHIFMHELGHHVDRMRGKSKRDLRGGEEFAEKYANDWFDRLWSEYISKSGLP